MKFLSYLSPAWQQASKYVYRHCRKNHTPKPCPKRCGFRPEIPPPAPLPVPGIQRHAMFHSVGAIQREFHKCDPRSNPQRYQRYGKNENPNSKGFFIDKDPHLGRPHECTLGSCVQRIAKQRNYTIPQRQLITLNMDRCGRVSFAQVQQRYNNCAPQQMVHHACCHIERQQVRQTTHDGLNAIAKEVGCSPIGSYDGLLYKTFHAAKKYGVTTTGLPARQIALLADTKPVAAQSGTELIVKTGHIMQNRGLLRAGKRMSDVIRDFAQTLVNLCMVRRHALGLGPHPVNQSSYTVANNFYKRSIEETASGSDPRVTSTWTAPDGSTMWQTCAHAGNTWHTHEAKQRSKYFPDHVPVVQDQSQIDWDKLIAESNATPAKKVEEKKPRYYHRGYIGQSRPSSQSSRPSTTYTKPSVKVSVSKYSTAEQIDDRMNELEKGGLTRSERAEMRSLIEQLDRLEVQETQRDSHAIAQINQRIKELRRGGLTSSERREMNALLDRLDALEGQTSGSEKTTSVTEFYARLDKTLKEDADFLEVIADFQANNRGMSTDALIDLLIDRPKPRGLLLTRDTEQNSPVRIDYRQFLTDFLPRIRGKVYDLEEYEGRRNIDKAKSDARKIQLRNGVPKRTETPVKPTKPTVVARTRPSETIELDIPPVKSEIDYQAEMERLVELVKQPGADVVALSRQMNELSRKIAAQGEQMKAEYTKVTQENVSRRSEPVQERVSESSEKILAKFRAQLIKNSDKIEDPRMFWIVIGRFQKKYPEVPGSDLKEMLMDIPLCKAHLESRKKGPEQNPAQEKLEALVKALTEDNVVQTPSRFLSIIAGYHLENPTMQKALVESILTIPELEKVTQITVNGEPFKVDQKQFLYDFLDVIEKGERSVPKARYNALAIQARSRRKQAPSQRVVENGPPPVSEEDPEFCRECQTNPEQAFDAGTIPDESINNFHWAKFYFEKAIPTGASPKEKAKIKKQLENAEQKITEIRQATDVLAEKGVYIQHRVYFSGSQLERFLEGNFRFDNVLDELENIDKACTNFGLSGIGTTVVLFWEKGHTAKNERRNKAQKIFLYTGGNAEANIMKYVKRRAEGRHLEDGQVGMEHDLMRQIDTELQQQLEAPNLASQIAQAELEFDTQRDLGSRIIAYMGAVRKGDFDGAKHVFGNHGDADHPVVLRGAPKKLTQSQLKDSTNYVYAAWAEFTDDPRAFLKRCAAEASHDTDSLSLLDQFEHNLDRIAHVTGDMNYSYEREDGKRVSLKSLYQDLQRAGSSSDRVRAIERFLSDHHPDSVKAPAKLTDHRIYKFLDDLTTFKRKDIVEPTIEIVHPDSLNPSERKSYLDALKREAPLDVLSYEGHEAELGAQVRRIKQFGGAPLLTNPYWKKVQAENKSNSDFNRFATYSGRPDYQDLGDVMPDRYWDQVREKHKDEDPKLEEKLGTLEGLIQSLNREHHVEIDITLLSDIEAVTKAQDGDDKPGVKLKILGNVEDLIDTFRAVDRKLDEYGDTKPFAGQKIGVTWYDHYDSSVLGYASQSGIQLKSVSSPRDIAQLEATIDHEFLHILDFKAGDTMERLWRSHGFERSIAQKRALQASGTPDQDLEYTFNDEGRIIRADDHRSDKGVMKGSPTQYSLTNTAEERAEIWRVYRSEGGYQALDSGAQDRLEVMVKVIVDQNILDRAWFTTGAKRLPARFFDGKLSDGSTI